MTGLEALEIIETYNYWKGGEDITGNLCINPDYLKSKKKYNEAYEILEKELQAFELVIKKNVIIPKLRLTQNFDIKEYNKGLSETRQLTNEERIIILEALKVFENEQKN